MTMPFNLIKCATQILLSSLTFGFCQYAQAEFPQVIVKTYGQHVSGNIVYHYQVTNNGIRNVVGVAIGLDTDDQGGDQPVTREQGELNFVMPIGLVSLDQGLAPGSVFGPTGWTAEMIQIEHAGRFLQWKRPPSRELSLMQGQTLSFSVTVPKQFEAYLSGHFSAYLPVDGGPRFFNGTMKKIDAIPPTLSITLTPNTLFPPNEKLIPITATITAQDDYDPQPEIKLESITANEKLEAEDIQDAAMGTDDRQFRLRAERRGERDNRDGRERDDRRSDKDALTVAPTGRIYTVTYSATDASGNKSTATATVTVPHDERGRDERDKK